MQWICLTTSKWWSRSMQCQKNAFTWTLCKNAYHLLWDTMTSPAYLICLFVIELHVGSWIGHFWMQCIHRFYNPVMSGFWPNCAAFLTQQFHVRSKDASLEAWKHTALRIHIKTFNFSSNIIKIQIFLGQSHIFLSSLQNSWQEPMWPNMTYLGRC